MPTSRPYQFPRPTNLRALLALSLWLSAPRHAAPFQPQSLPKNPSSSPRWSGHTRRAPFGAVSAHLASTSAPSRSTPTILGMASDDDPTNQQDKYSAEVRLRVEAESPFRNVRFLGYGALLAGATISFLLSATRIAAALNGINVDLLQESATNAAIDALGMVVLGLLLRNDWNVQQSRLKMAARGGELAGLNVRIGSSAAGGGEVDDDEGAAKTTVPLSSLRRGRGIEKRVVISVAGKDAITKVLEEARRLDASLTKADLLVVPVVIPQYAAPLDVNSELLELECVALPAGGNWRAVIEDEANEARQQGVNVEEDGMCIVLKKNGRVGQRTRGIYLGRMVGEVEERREVGMDVSNI